MEKEKPFIDRSCLLQKYPGKGGWTYAEVPEISPDKRAPFGWVTVRGWIDDFELKRFKLMPMGNGKLFLSVRKEIRKKIGKEAGDFVWVKLYPDTSTVEIPEEIILCFEQEPKKAYTYFLSLSAGEQQSYLEWIYSAKKDQTKVERIAQMMERLLKKQKL